MLRIEHTLWRPDAVVVWSQLSDNGLRRTNHEWNHTPQVPFVDSRARVHFQFAVWCCGFGSATFVWDLLDAVPLIYQTQGSTGLTMCEWGIKDNSFAEVYRRKKIKEFVLHVSGICRHEIVQWHYRKRKDDVYMHSTLSIELP